MSDSLNPTPELRLVVDNSAAFDRAFDIFMRIKDVAPDPDGEHLWLLLEPKGAPAT